MTPRLSLVIPVLNATRTLPRTLEALIALAPAPDEIVLVDNGSIDDTLQRLQAFAAAARTKVVLLREPRRGASVARNTGARAATGDVVVFTDADCCPRADWLAALREPLREAGVGAVAGRLASTPPRGVVETFSSLFTLQRVVGRAGVDEHDLVGGRRPRNQGLERPRQRAGRVQHGDDQRQARRHTGAPGGASEA